MEVLSRPSLVPGTPENPRGSAPFSDQPYWLWRGRVPCLDGLRAISILLVLAAHLGYNRIIPVNPLFSDALVNLGPLGVSMFFVISGFLITLLLIRERAKTGTVCLRSFYLRRAFRILPAYLAYLTAVLLLSRLHKISPTRHDWLIALTYTGSIFKIHTWELGHLWSLAVEEQFYLVWPLVLFLIKPRRAAIAAAGCIVLTLLARIVCLRYWPSIDVDYFTLTRMDCIAFGCLLGVVATEPSHWRLRALLSRGGSSIGVFAAAGLVFSFVLTTHRLAHVLFYWLSPTVLDIIRYRYAVPANTVDAALICAVIWSFSQHRDHLPGRILEARPLAKLGVLSYSLYLWQQLFLNRGGTTGWIYGCTLRLVGVGLAAMASYYLIEAPFLRIKDRWKR